MAVFFNAATERWGAPRSAQCVSKIVVRKDACIFVRFVRRIPKLLEAVVSMPIIKCDKYSSNQYYYHSIESI